MKAFRNVAGNVVEIEVDTNPDGTPILPPDTTVDPRPDPQEGHYVTVVGKEWVQIPIPVPYSSFEIDKQNAMKAVRDYRDWLFVQPVEHESVMFDGDETARARLTQAIVMNGVNGYLAPAWVTYANGAFPLASVEDLKGIANAVQVAFATRFFEMATLRGQVEATTNAEELAAVTIPAIPQPVVGAPL